MTPLPKPVKPEKSKRVGISPKCGTCAHTSREHYASPGMRLCSLCDCTRFVMRVSVRRSTSVPRKAQPIKRKTMPRCKHCAHPERKHWDAIQDASPATAVHCYRCSACPGYEPARGIRQKRRTPAAAVKRIADDLWSRIVHARPEPCEVQHFYSHECVGGSQAMHGIPRTFKATRHLPINGFKGCAGIHTFFTARKEMWDSVLLDAWGEPTFRELWRLARSSQSVDMDATVASLRAELARTGA